MSKRMSAWIISLIFIVLPAYGADHATTAEAVGNQAATAEVAKSLEQMATEVKNLLVKEKVRNIFDLFRRLREEGVTWQPSLTAPNDLVNKLDDEQLRLYAGVKLFDALYAATFMQRQAVSDSLQTIEAIQEKLNLRAYADLSGNFFKTLKKAAANPQSVNVQLLLEQLATDYVQDIPALMSSPKSADYLIDSLYGFTIENGHVLGYFFQNDLKGLDKAIHQQPDRGEWQDTMVKLFKAFDRMDEKIRVSGETTEKVAVIERMVAVTKADPDTNRSEAIDTAWKEIAAQNAAIRAAILTPSAK